MFILIDNWLIKWAQFFVWFIELFTCFTKKMIATLLLVIIKSITWSNVLILTLLSLHSIGYTLIVLATACAAQLAVCGLYDSWLHESIVSRNRVENNRNGRLIMAFISLFQVSFFTPYILLSDTDILSSLPIDEFVIQISMYGVCFCFFCSFVLGYLLCAQSLPPQEKHKRDFMRSRRNR